MNWNNNPYAFLNANRCEKLEDYLILWMKMQGKSARK